MSNPKSIIRDPNHEYTEETNKRKLCNIVSTVDEEHYFELMDTTDIIDLPLSYETSLLHISMQINKVKENRKIKMNKCHFL